MGFEGEREWRLIRIESGEREKRTLHALLFAFTSDVFDDSSDMQREQLLEAVSILHLIRRAKIVCYASLSCTLGRCVLICLIIFFQLCISFAILIEMIFLYKIRLHEIVNINCSVNCYINLCKCQREDICKDPFSL